MAIEPVSTVVIGYGYAGERIHVPLIRLARELRLLGVCSSDPAKRQRIETQLGCRTYATFEQVLDDPAVQLVVLATPNTLHAPQAIAAMAAGKHVVVDKPMCLSHDEAERMIRASEEHQRILSVFHNRRLDSDYLTLRHLIDSGQLGEVRWLEMAWQRFGLPRTWRQKASEGGGRLLDLGSHMLDQILQIFPAKVSSLYCRVHRDWGNVDIESHAMLTLGFEDGRTAIIDAGSMSRIPKPRIFAVGSNATFAKYGMDPQEAALAAGNIDGAQEAPESWGTLADAGGSRRVQPIPGHWRSYYENVGQVLQSPDPWQARERLLVKPREVARVIAILELAGRRDSDGVAVPVAV